MPIKSISQCLSLFVDRIGLYLVLTKYLRDLHDIDGQSYLIWRASGKPRRNDAQSYISEPSTHCENVHMHDDMMSLNCKMINCW